MAVNFWHPEVPIWCNSSSQTSLLQMDQACLHIQFHDKDPQIHLELWGQSTKCKQCSLWRLSTVEAGPEAAVVLNTTYPTLLVMKTRSGQLCNFTHHFGEFGDYRMNVTDGFCSDLSVDIEPANIYLSLLWSGLALLSVLFLWIFKCSMRERCLLNRTTSDAEARETLVSPDSSPHHGYSDAAVVRNRIRSLDTFRGLTVAMMILINYGGGGFWLLQHAPWNGLTLADLVFPWFVWIMGASCVLSLNSQLRRALAKKRILAGILRRSAGLFVIGLLLNSRHLGGVATLRIPGVLQRLAVVYLVVAILELFGLDPEDNQRYAWYASVRDVVTSWIQWTVVSFLVLAHLLITFLLPVPGCPQGYVGPGGLETGGRFSKCTGGAAQLVDVAVFGSRHIYQRPTAAAVYDTSVPFDPEGLVGTLTCVLCAYLGVEAGKVLLTFQANTDRILRWTAWSAFTGLIGGALCLFSEDEGPVPINKNLWSLSYVLVAASTAFMAFVLLYVLVDALAWWSGAPFRYAGMNAMVLYVGHIVARPMLPFSWTPWSTTHAALWTVNVVSVCVWIGVSWLLYRRRFFITL